MMELPGSSLMTTAPSLVGMAAKPKRKPNLTPFLWFDDQLQEAAAFYAKVFPGSRSGGAAKYGKDGPGKEGQVMSMGFDIAGHPFGGINGGPLFKFNEAVSFMIDCQDQAEVDYYWDALTADGGTESQCGWLKDRFGLSWQVVPVQLTAALGDPDPQRAQRAMQAMLTMRKIDIAAIEAAADGKAPAKVAAGKKAAARIRQETDAARRSAKKR